MKIKVICQPVFQFTHGVVTGFIEMDPMSVLESIYMHVALDYKGPHRLTVRNLITKEVSRRIDRGQDPNIILDTGVVARNFVEISLWEATDLILDFLGIWDEDDEKYNMLKSCREFVQFIKYVRKCDSCDDISQTANIPIEE